MIQAQLKNETSKVTALWPTIGRVAELVIPLCKPDATQKKTILIYSHDTFGLGNIRRMLAIAEELVANDPALHVLMITGSPMLHSFRISERIDFIKLPCLSRDQKGSYHARSLPMKHHQLLEIRARLILSTIEGYQPDLILVDKKPMGVGGELKQALVEASNLPIKPKVVLVLRDILDTPKSTRKVWRRKKYHQAIDQFYDLVLVLGQPEIFNVSAEYQFPESTRKRIRYCGYVQRKDAQYNAPKQSNSNLPQVLVTTGGGADGYYLIESFLLGLKQQTNHPGFYSKLIYGPEMQESQRNRLLQLASECQDVVIQESTNQMEKLIGESDLVVSMCGYNTICEVIAIGKQSIVVPRVSPVEEQWIRATKFADSGLLTTLHPEQVSPEMLMQTIHETLGKAITKSPITLDFDGLQRINYWTQRLLTKNSTKTRYPVFSRKAS